MVDLSIIIVSWNVADLLEACLDSIQAQAGSLRLEIIVVDSASSDGTPARVRARYPHVTLLPQADNLGFTRSSNLGLAVASGRHFLLLNPDTEILPGALAEMVAYLDAHPDVGIVGPHTLNTDGTHQSTRRRFPTLATGLFESTWLQPFAPPGVLRRYYAADIPNDAVADVDWVQGSALMARRQVWEQIGDLDEGYVMYAEELDWCRRAKDAGWRVVYLGTARILHHGGRSAEQAGARKHILFQTSKLRYFRKHHGRLVAHALRSFLLLSYLWQMGLESFKGLLGHKPSLRRARVQTYWQVLRSGLKVT